MDKKNITLRIKKVYFDQILRGEKRVEYRDAKPYYDRMFKERPHTLILHYQRAERIFAQVKRIRKIRTPKRLLLSKIKFGEYVYAIELGEVSLHINS